MKRLEGTARGKQLAQLHELMKASVASAMLSQLAKLLDRAPDDLWAKLEAISSSLLADDSLAAAFDAQLGSLGATADDVRPALESHLAGVVKTKLRAEVDGLRYRLLRRFERAFRYDGAGLPRVWTPKDDVREACVRAKGVALEMLSLYRELEAAGFNGGVELLTDEEAAEIEISLEQEVAAAYQTAKLAQEALAVHSRTPTWALVLLPILGFNEAVALLSSPIVLALLLTVAPLIFMLNRISPGLPLALARKWTGLKLEL